MDSTLITYLIPLAGVIALIYAFIRTQWVNKQDVGTPLMAEIAGNIADGARAFLRREYRVLVIFVAAVAALLAFANMGQTNSSWLIAVSFLVGAFCSGLAGFIGMNVATKANVRTTNAARTGLGPALNVAFSGGLVMGLSVVGLGVIGLSVLFIVYSAMFIEGAVDAPEIATVINVLAGFSLGASSIALFARVGGGIYTKAADVGADLAGKVYEGIPEDDPRNPATIADNVGDNVGDVAGMGADLFESYVGSIIGAMVLGAAFLPAFLEIGPEMGLAAVMLPLVLAAVGILVSVAGSFFVKVKEGGDPQKALNIGEFGAVGIMILFAWLIVTMMLPGEWVATTPIVGEFTYSAFGVFMAVVIGLIAGTAIGLVTEHYTALGKGPVNGIAAQSVTGSATNIIAGLGVGMFSTGFPALILAGAIMGAYFFAGLYGIAIAAVGMLSVTGIQLAVDAYGPISDNAGGIAEMADLPPEVRERTDKLDAVGNTTAAIGKGFAIGSAALTALGLFAAYMTQAGVENLDVANPTILSGVLIGAMLPYVFSAMAMGAVGRAAGEMIEEVGRQFREIPGLREGTAKAEYAKCVDISTKAAIREMIAPGLLAVTVPVVVGFISPSMLGGLLVGVTVSGVLFAIFQSNAGGAWDNAKKTFEASSAGYTINGEPHVKGSVAHKAAVVGDTVGDPLKDTSGPSLNILLKLIAVVALVIAPLISDADATMADTDVTVVEMPSVPAFNLVQEGGALVLSGAVASQEAMDALVQRARRTFPNLDIVNNMQVGELDAVEGFQAKLFEVFPFLGRFRSGAGMDVDGTNVTLSGVVFSDEEKAAIDADAEALLTAPFSYTSGITVEAPSEDVVAAMNAIGEVLNEQTVEFATGTSELTASSRATLDAIAANLTAYSELGITVEGHTDNTGAQETNDTLSQQRAQAVAGYLAGQGVDATRIAAVGYGDARPIASNATEEGRAANRRVAFRVG